MFFYGKRSAAIFLALYIIVSAVIIVFSLLPANVSSEMSYSFYDTVSHIKFGQDKKTEDKEAVAITSMEIKTSKIVYPAKTRVNVSIISVLPENHTENYSLKTDDNAIAEIATGNQLLLNKEGIVNVWAETASGLKSNIITITVYDRNGGGEIDSERIELIAPDQMPIGQAFYPYIKVDGAAASYNAVYTSDSDVLEEKNGYFIAKSAGMATISISLGGQIKKTKTIEITEDALSVPSIASFSLDGNILEDRAELSYLTEYEPEITFEGDCCQLIYYVADEKIVSIPYSYGKKSARIRVIGIGEFDLKIMSPLRSEPLKTVHIKTVPPKADVLGLKKTDIVYVDYIFPLTLNVTDKASLYGIVCEISSENDLPYERTDDDHVLFKSEGRYTLTYTSQYYPDFLYVYTVVVEDIDKATATRKTLGHAALFAALGVFALLAFGFYFKTKPLMFAVTALSGILTAIISEVLQLPLFTSGRGASVEDVFIDLAGFVAGVALCIGTLFVIYLIRRRKNLSASSNTVE